MKKVFASMLVLTMLAGAGAAEANWFWHKAETKQEMREQRAEAVTYQQGTENKKWVYNGNNGYRSIAGQVAVEDRIGDLDDAAFTVHPTYGSRLGASLRQGDTGQSGDTRVNHSFNN